MVFSKCSAALALLAVLGAAQAQDNERPENLEILWEDNDAPSSRIVASLASDNRFDEAYIPKLAISVYVAKKSDTSTVYREFCKNEINYAYPGSVLSCETQVKITFANEQSLSFTTYFKQGELIAKNDLRSILDEDNLKNGNDWDLTKLSTALATSGKVAISIAGDILPEKVFEITINPDSAQAISITNDPSGTLPAGTSSLFTVSLVDTYGNVAINAANSKLTMTPNTGDAFDIPLVAGQGEKKFTRTTPQDVVLTPSHQTINVIQPSSFSLSFIPGATRQVVSSSTVKQVAAGQGIEVTLTALDAYNNINTRENRQVNLVEAGTNTIYGLVTLAAGVGKVMVKSEDGRVLVIVQAPVSSFAGVKFNPETGLTLTFTAVCDGVTGYQDEEGQTVCKDVRVVCEPGTFQKVSPTSTNNRECEACDGVGFYQDQEDQVDCKAMSEDCVAGTSVLVAPSAANDIECEACDGVLTFSDTVNSPACVNISVCVAGEQIVAEPTASSNRQCGQCPPGFHDHDVSGSTSCIPCNPELSASANITNSLGWSIVTFTQLFNLSTDVTIVESGMGMAVTSYEVLSGSCRSNLTTYPVSAAIVNGDQSSDFDLYGLESVFGRGVVITYSNPTGTLTLTACADVSQWVSADLTYSDEKGLTQCKNVSTCPVGQETLAMATHMADQTCAACNGVTKYQDVADSRFCAVVDVCAAGLKPVVFPTAFINRECGDVSCTGLNPPLYGSITNCNGTDKVEAYQQTCTYACDGVGFIPVDVTRTCQQDGSFDGTAPVCECDGTLNLDTINGECVKFCPTGFIQRDGENFCSACSDACTEGSYESQQCDPSLNEDRECSVCSICEAGTWGVDGCFAGNNTNTICVPFTDCDPGFYETVAGTPITDRACDQCRACDASIGLFQASGCCGAEDSVCDSLTSCPGDTFELKAPADAPQGGFNYDRVCKVLSECGSGEFLVAEGNANTDTNCQACGDCEDGSYKVGDCNATHDTQCSLWQECATGSVQSGGSSFTDVDCVPCKTCDANFEHEVTSCSSSNDTQCAPLTVCDPVTEYQLTDASATSDRVCETCSNCSDGVTTAACSAMSNAVCGNTSYTADCPRGTVEYGIVPFTVCVGCVSCADGTYANGGLYCRVAGIKKAFSTQCESWTDCPDGFVQTQAPTSTTDRACTRCATCPIGFYPTNQTLCTADVDALQCTLDTPCEEGSYESIPLSDDSPRECTPCATCEEGEYQARECGASYDRICSTISECAWDQQVLAGATATSDTTCLDCEGVVLAVPNADRNLCPLPYAEEKCDAPTPPTNDNVNVYTAFDFVIDADYDAVITQNPAYSHRVKFFQDQLQIYLTNEAPLGVNSSIGDVKAVQGSIVVSFSVFDSVVLNDTSRGELVDALTGWLASGAFDFEFEGTTYQLDNNTITTESVDPLATGSPTLKPTASPVVSTTTPIVTTTQVAPTTAPSTAPTALATASASNGLGSGAVAGIVVGCIIVLILILIVVALVRQQSDRNMFKQGMVSSSVDNDDYLTVNTESEGGIDGDMTDENNKLQREVDAMGTRIARKNAVISEQHKSQQLAQRTLEVAIAAKLKKENDSLQAEIQAMKDDLKKKRQNSKFQKAAALQAQLKAEKLALEEEIVRSDQVAQIALEALSEYDTLQADLEEEEQQARQQEIDRIQEEKDRLAGEMSRLTERLSGLG